MVRKSLIAVALWAVSSPLAAQDEYVWTSDRPDGQAPIGVSDERTLEEGAIEITYKFTQMNYAGVWFVRDSLGIAQVFQSGFQVAPRALTEQRHTAMVSYGVSENLTITATGSFSVFERKHQDQAGRYFVAHTTDPGDVTATAIYQIYGGGPFRLHASVGALIPTGKSRTWDCTPYSDPSPTPCSSSSSPQEPLPYDTRPGAGTFAVMPGISGQVQNDFGSLGAQFKGRFHIGEGPRNFTYGDRYEANGWAAYRFNSVISASWGIRWQSWGNVEGADPLLDPDRDPGNAGLFHQGQQADMPVGINFVIPGDGPLGGHRLFFEGVYSLHKDFEGPQMGLDWGVNLGWRMGM